MKTLLVPAIFGLVLVVIAIVVRSGALARKNPGEPINSAMRAAMEAPQFSTEDAKIIAEKYPTAKKLSSGLLYIVHAPGEGEPPSVGASVTVHYDGRFLDGKTFDSSREKKRPFVFRVGVGDVIKGWDEAFLGMKKGERRTLIIPHWLAYGETARGPIPPRATLVFDAELLDIK